MAERPTRGSRDREGVDADACAARRRQLLDALAEPGPSVISAAASVGRRRRRAATGDGRRPASRSSGSARTPGRVLAERASASADDHRPGVRRLAPTAFLAEQAARREPLLRATLGPIVIDVDGIDRGRRPSHGRWRRSASIAGMTDRTAAHPRRRHRDRRQPGPALRRRLAGRRARRRHLRLGQRRRPPGRDQHPGHPRARRTDRRRGRARPRGRRSSARSRRRRRPTGRRASATPSCRRRSRPLSRAARRRPDRRRGPPRGPARSRWSRSGR